MLMGTLTDEDTSFGMLDHFVDHGGTFIDTANAYCWWNNPGSHGGESEALIGRWFARTGRRDDVFLATKGSGLIDDLDAVWVDGGPDWTAARQHFDGAGGDNLRRSVDDSLRRLQTDRIDLYYVHVDDRSTPIEETLQALADVVTAGKVRYIGWSNVRTWRLERIRQVAADNGWPVPVAVQQQHSYLRPRGGLEDNVSVVTDEQLDYLRVERGLTLVAYSPLVKGAFDDPAKRGTGVLDPYRGADSDARFAVVDAIAKEVSATGGQVVLAWLLAQRDPAVVALIGPRTRAQYDVAWPGLELTLTEEHLARLGSAGA
jgi:aryl-alcohol dehydrogenase-like predicted oxidoreductase